MYCCVGKFPLGEMKKKMKFVFVSAAIAVVYCFDDGITTKMNIMNCMLRISFLRLKVNIFLALSE